MIVEVLQNAGPVNEIKEGQRAQSAAEVTAERAIRGSQPAAKLYRRVTHSHRTEFIAVGSNGYYNVVGEVRDGDIQIYQDGMFAMSREELRDALRDGSVTKIG
jgi:hypothetical protein